MLCFALKLSINFLIQARTVNIRHYKYVPIYCTESNNRTARYTVQLFIEHLLSKLLLVPSVRTEASWRMAMGAGSRA